MEPRLIREYVAAGRLRIVFRDYAFLGQESLDAAAAARAAGEQGAFWPYHDWLFANQAGENRGAFRREVLVEIARRVGLDVARFERDLDDPATAAAVAAERDAAASVPVNSTPTLVLNGQVIEGGLAWETLAVAIDAATAACRFARAVAGAAENAGEHVRFPVDHVGVAVAASGDQPDVFGNGGVGGARPLAIYDLMEIVWLVDIGRLQIVSLLRLLSFFTAQLCRRDVLTLEP